MSETKTYRMEGEIRLLAPLSHIGESSGTTSFLREDLVIGPDGQPVEVFSYSGNAFRGAMRDAGVQYLLDRLGGLQIPLDSFHLLFSGGSLGSDTSVDLEQARLYRRMLPLFSIFGGGTGNQIIPGKLRVGQMYPITVECARLIPERYRSDDLPSWRQWTVDMHFTRTDDSKDERLRGYLAEPESAPKLIEGANGPNAKQKDQPQQMRYTVEALAAGSVLWQRIDLVAATQIELGAWVSCLAQWAQSPYLGGKAGVGFGLCEASWTCQESGEAEPKPFATIGEGTAAFGPVAAEAKESYDAFVLDMYTTYIEGRREELIKLLGVS